MSCVDYQVTPSITTSRPHPRKSHEKSKQIEKYWQAGLCDCESLPQLLFLQDTKLPASKTATHCCRTSPHWQQHLLLLLRLKAGRSCHQNHISPDPEAPCIQTTLLNNIKLLICLVSRSQPSRGTLWLYCSVQALSTLHCTTPEPFLCLCHSTQLKLTISHSSSHHGLPTATPASSAAVPQ